MKFAAQASGLPADASKNIDHYLLSLRTPEAMTPLFADTSFFVAFLSPDDEHHETAVQYMEEYPSTLLTTKWVAGGARDLPFGAAGAKAFKPFVEALWEDGLVRVEEATDEWFIRS